MSAQRSQKPRISVVIPCYDGRRYLNECLRAIAELRDPSYEVVVVDDGSREKIRDVVERWAPLARYIRQRNQGPGAARNTGVAATSGEYVRFVDCDDNLLPSALAEQVAVLDAHPEVGLVHGAALKIDADGRPFGVRRPSFARRTLVRSGEDELADLLLGNYVTTSTTLIRRSVLEQVGPFRTDIKGPEDWDCWLRIAQVASFGYVDEPIVAYRYHQTSITALYTPDRWLEMHHDILDRQFASPRFPRRYAHMRPAANARLHRIAAVLAYANRRMGLARGYALSALASTARRGDWRASRDCLWLVAKSFVPSALRRPLRRAARRYRGALVPAPRPRSQRLRPAS
ncbi:MAG TPA: glycosyltransferase [Chloroflexota bacterium]|jgi:glycosyltransferase involved in cell wall biosynthesis|nr:glycosyltransferase [Chloroflexota bacterium]